MLALPRDFERKWGLMQIRTAVVALLMPGLLAGCMSAISAGNCLDALVPRGTTPVLPVHVFELKYKDQASTSVRIACENYYDAMCAARGNQWSVREIGSTVSPYVVKFLTVHDEQLGTIEIARPSCEVWGQATPERMISWVRINGEHYNFVSNGSSGYVYSRPGFINRSNPPVGPDKVVLDFVAKYDGRVLQPELPTPP